MLLWFSSTGKFGVSDWPKIKALVGGGYEVLSFDFRGLGEDRMLYDAGSPGDPNSAAAVTDAAYLSPLAGVLANYIYNSLLTGRPYFLQMIEDAEIVSRFARAKISAERVLVTARGDGYTLACAVAEAVPGVEMLPQPGEKRILWSELVAQKRELWPIHYLLPGGAYIR